MATALANTPDRRKESPVPADRTPSAYASGLPALVARHAEQTPQALAVMDGDTTLTYAQLVTSATGWRCWYRDRPARLSRSSRCGGQARHACHSIRHTRVRVPKRCSPPPGPH